MNTAEEWLLTSGTDQSNGAGHPFHIHVNPFQHLVYETDYALRNSQPDKAATADMLLTAMGITSDLSVALTWNDGKCAQTTLKYDAANTVKQLLEAISGTLDEKFTGRYEVVKDGTAIRDKVGAIEDLTIGFGDQDNLLSFTIVRRLVDRVWRDTLLAPSGKTETIRTRFRDWTGKTVIHCHIVDHEDQGMMKNVLILGEGEGPPDQAGGGSLEGCKPWPNWNRERRRRLSR